MIIANNFSKKKVKKKTKKIIIGTFFGSTDRLNCNGRLLKIFSQKEFNKFKFIFLLGKNNKNKVKIRKTYQKYQNFHFETKFINIRKFYKKLDILINVGGVTSFEALASNVKCIYIPINYYQKTTCDFLKKQKINNVLNYNQVFNKRGKKLLFNCLDKISKNRKSLTKNIHFDHHGSKRIADYILSKKFNKNLQFN